MVWGQLALAGVGLYAWSLNRSLGAVRDGLNPPPYRRLPRARVSLCVPAYNESGYIGTLLTSALNQTEPFAEMVVADSSHPEEGTRRIAQRLGARVVRADYGNVAVARNIAARAATGEVIMFADADITLSQRVLEHSLDALEAGYLCVHPRFLIEDSAAWQLLTWPVYAFRTRSLTGGCVTVAKATWSAVGGYDEGCNPRVDRCREDLAFGRQIARAYGVNALKVLGDVAGCSARRYYSYWGNKTFEPVRDVITENPKAGLLLALLAEIPGARTFVEMGCLRHSQENLFYGYSTLYLAREASQRGGMLHSVDLDPQAVATAQGVIDEARLAPWVNLIVADAVAYLQTFQGEIDFLYLDGPDHPAITLAAFRAAEDRLSRQAVVAIDDCMRNWFQPLGKGAQAIPYAQARGWQVAMVPTYGRMVTAILRRGYA